MKIFLTADVHLGMKFAGYSEVQKELSEARFETLRKLITLANESQSDIFAVAGDLFDHLRVAERDVVLAAQIISQFNGKLSVVLPGNHDFIVAGESKVWPKFKANAGDRVLLLEEAKVYNLKHYDLDANLYPGPCNAKHSGTNRIAWIKDEPKDTSIKYHIGIAHGSMSGVSPDLAQEYFPMTEEELQGAGLDLWLLGHTDRMQYPAQTGPMNRFFYPGTPEPNGFDCDHGGSAWLLELDDHKKVTALSVPCGKHRFLHDEVSLSTDTDLDNLVKNYSVPDFDTVMMKLKLKGRLPKDSYDRLLKVVEDVEKCFLYAQVDISDVKQAITVESIKREFTDSSFPYRLLVSLAENQDSDETLQTAYDIIKELKK